MDFRKLLQDQLFCDRLKKKINFLKEPNNVSAKFHEFTLPPYDSFACKKKKVTSETKKKNFPSLSLFEGKERED